MDNVTHSMVGAALAETGLRDRFALATPTLVLAANIPDVDAISYLVADEFAALAWRRGVTHGIPALVVWPFLVAGLMIAWDVRVRRRRRPAADPARFGPLLGLAALGALTHPTLDWLNNYGMRWGLPFHGGWTYGDAVFIIDPWLWLGLGGTVFLARARTWTVAAPWLLGAALATLLVVATDVAPAGARVLWGLALVTVLALRWLRPLHTHPARRQRFARVATAAAAAYILAMMATSGLAQRGARIQAAALGIDVTDVMTAPRPAQLVDRDVVVRTPDHYRQGSWRWDRTPRLELADEPIPLRRGPDPILDAALRDSRARHFLVWSRYPYVHARPVDGRWIVRVGDARYARDGLGGLDIVVEP